MTYGPIDFYVFEFQNERLKGEVLPELIDLVQKEVVRVIDLVIIQKDKEGKHQAVEMQELDPETIALYDPLQAEISGLIQVEDVDAIAGQMDNDTTAAALLIENLWAVKFKEAVLRADGQVIAQVRITHEVVEEALEIFASAQ